MSNSIYVGLSEKSRLWVLGLGAFIAVINLAVAWFFAFRMGESLRLDASDLQPFTAWMATGGGSTVSGDAKYDLAARSLHIVAFVKLIANKQGLVLACFGGAFALAAIGFALFIIGADGAFKVSAGANDKARLVLSGTAPGLLCFLICGWLISQGIKEKSTMNLPPLAHMSQGISAQVTQACDNKHPTNGKCYTNAEWAKFLNP